MNQKSENIVDEVYSLIYQLKNERQSIILFIEEAHKIHQQDLLVNLLQELQKQRDVVKSVENLNEKSFFTV